jgi:hypothetical protein
MATSVYFNNYGSHAEQRVIEDLIVESIKIMGFDAFYLPNDNDAARDLLFGEDPTKKFRTAFPLELYLSSSTEYMGEKEFFSKFGLEIKNNVNVILSKRSFSQRVQQNNFSRPREGDLIYIPFLNGTGEIYEIKFTNQTKDFFMLGRKVPYFYELELEKFKYAQEVIETGVDSIDDIVLDSGYTINLNVIKDTKTTYTSLEWSSGLFDVNKLVFSATGSGFIDSLDNLSVGDTVQFLIPDYSSSTITATITAISNFALNDYRLSLNITISGLFAVSQITIYPSIQNPTTTAGSGTFTLRESVYQSLDGTSANSYCYATLQYWNSANGTLSITNINGEFASNTYVYGETSGAYRYVTDYDAMETAPKNENFDNKFIEDAANQIINTSEINPFGDI